MPAAKQRVNPKEGLEFVRKYKHKTYKLKVVKIEGGIGYVLGGKIFTSPSTAAKTITNSEVNGWKFWHMD